MKYDSAALEGVSKRLRRDMWQTAAPDAVLECGIEERWFGPVQVTVIECLPDALAVNRVLGAAEPGAVEEGHLAAAIEWAESLYLDYRVPVARSRPGMEAAEKWLNEHGFEQKRGLVKYVRDVALPDLPPFPEITIWEIGEDEADGETMVFDVAPTLGLPSAAGSLLFGLPSQDNWRSYTAELEGRIVSFGSMLIHNGVAALDFDATLESDRGRGCNRALLGHRLLTAFEAGCETIVAEMPESEDQGIAAAARNLLRAGFLPAYRSMNWQRPRCWTTAETIADY